MTAANFVRPKPALFYEARLDLAAMDRMAEQLRTRHLCITLNPGQRTLNLSGGDTTNNRKARSDGPRNLRGFVFVDSAPPLDWAARWTGSSLRN
jgi:hypothetical protein